MQSKTNSPQSVSIDRQTVLSRLVSWTEGRTGISGFTRKALRKVFPDHWSYLIGEVCLYSFFILIVTGIFLSFFFQPSLNQVQYHGSYVPLAGSRVPESYASILRISFDVRGGLLVRQIHHWASLIFVSAIFVHMLRVFFTGAFRKPREMNWLIGFGLLVLAMVESYLGNLLPGDLLAGTGLVVLNGYLLSLPIVGTYLSMFVFGGSFPGTDYVERFYSLHILLLPGIMVGLVVVHMVLVVVHGHAQYPGPGRTEKNVVGKPLFPAYFARVTGFFFLYCGFMTIIAACAQINPVWDNGPYRPDQVSAGSQPDWYMGFADGLVRIMPGWEINLWGHTLIPGVLIPLLGFGVILLSIGLYPLIEAWVTDDPLDRHLLDRPRNNPVRTALGAAWISVYLVLLAAGGNDIIATRFDLSVESIIWTSRVCFFAVPVIVFIFTKRWALGLQRADRDLVLHGRESGTIRRLTHGEYVEIHAPLSKETLYKLTSHRQPSPLSRAEMTGRGKLAGIFASVRVSLSEFLYGPGSHIPKPTREEYDEAHASRVE
ncbi:Cytochrome b6 [Streptomyces sp. ADI93-02]|nr:Cytochrome b6 [Streptomyces sp. ADI93-02]